MGVSAPNFFFFQCLEGLKDRIEVPAAQFLVKCIGKTLQINVCGAEHPAQAAKRFRIDEAIGMEDIEKSLLLYKIAGIQHVFKKDDGLYVGVGYRTSPHLAGLLHHNLRREIVIIQVLRRDLGYLPVLAKLTMKIASCCGQGKGSRARKDMKKRFLLDRI